VLHEIVLEHAVDDEVGVAADRRSEVGVVFFVQAVVTVVGMAVNGIANS
jgi:hypothetical protein